MKLILPSFLIFLVISDVFRNANGDKVDVSDGDPVVMKKRLVKRLKTPREISPDWYAAHGYPYTRHTSGATSRLATQLLNPLNVQDTIFNPSNVAQNLAQNTFNFLMTTIGWVGMGALYNAVNDLGSKRRKRDIFPQEEF